MEKEPLKPEVALESLSDEEEDMLAGMRAIIEGYYETGKTNAQNLQEKFFEIDKSENGKENFDIALKDVTTQYLMNGETEFNNNVKKIKVLRKKWGSDSELQDLMARQREIFAETSELILEMVDIPTEASLSELEAGAINIQKRIKKFSDNEGSSEEVLKSLGIIQQKPGEDEPRFVYPYDLFPKGTNKKWNRYVESVNMHLSVVENLEQGYGSQQEVMDADQIGRRKHDSVARDVHKLLGLENIAKEDWDFERTRNMLAKMRDERFGNIETSEISLTSQALSQAALNKALFIDKAEDL